MLQKYFALVAVLWTTLSLSAMTGGQPEELGNVQWNRKMENAVALSKQSGKPILILFQEVPGCMTCRNYGNFVMFRFRKCHSSNVFQ